MSTYRFFAGRLMRFATHGLKRLLGRRGPQILRQIPRILVPRAQPTTVRGSRNVVAQVAREEGMHELN